MNWADRDPKSTFYWTKRIASVNTFTKPTQRQLKWTKM